MQGEERGRGGEERCHSVKSETVERGVEWGGVVVEDGGW